MLSLNIKSKNYMSLDIEKDSVVHNQLVKKLTNLSSFNLEYIYDEEVFAEHNPVIGNKKDTVGNTSIHRLTKLPSFHISLGAPPPNSQIKTKSVNIHKPQLHELIGVITLADINVSENQNKKSAWISIDNSKFILAHQIHDFSFLNSENLHLHISLANLTGNPHDSIARPEDCIIDTITA